MIIGFDSLLFMAIESEGEVQVCASIFNSPLGALESFTIGYVPGEEYESSNEEYQLECNRELSFLVGDHSVCYNYTIIDDDECELQDDDDSYFEVSLSVISPIKKLTLDFNYSSAGVTIDDSNDKECYVRVGYEENSYTLSEESGYVELCVKATSPGISEEFYVSLEINTTDDILEQSVDGLLFSVNETNNVTKICYNISNKTSPCYFYTECESKQDIPRSKTVEVLIQKSQESDRVSLLRSKVEVLLINPIQCSKNCLLNNSSSDDNSVFTDTTTNNSRSSNVSENNGSVSVIVTATLLGIVIISCTIIAITTFLYLRIKKFRDRKSSKLLDQIQNERHKFTVSDELMNMLREKRMIFSKNSIELSSIVGQGESGLVYRAYLKTKDGNELVAVKTVKALFSRTVVVRLAKEVSTMLSF